ncbi:MAG: hypothetical protein JXA74_01915, partial [Anaerolineae bacterium]|nr:hypothetical protein [Anaerolineae bacterium]
MSAEMTTTVPRLAERRAADRTGNNVLQRRIVQGLAFGLVWLAGAVAVAALVWIVGYVMVQGVQSINIEFLTTRPAGGVSGEGGMSTTIV